jgi:glycosyltransferase involved in cell wall biosynthesis
MNLLVVIHYPVYGGPHEQVANLAPVLERSGIRTTVILTDEPGNAFERLRGEGINVIAVPLQRLRGTLDPREQLRSVARFIPDVRAIRREIRRHRIDLVQVSGLVNVHGAAAARLEGLPVVWQVIDTRAPMLLRRAFAPVVQGLADVVMSTGAAVARVHPGLRGFGDRLYVFFMPVDPAVFDPAAVDSDAARTSFGFAPKDCVVGTVGNLNPQKGHEFLLRATARILIEKDVKLLIVGAPHDTHRHYERELYRTARDLGLVLGEDVVFTGGLTDVRPALAAMDVFLLSSVERSEGAPAAVEEAMMMGLPVVATNVGALDEVVEDGSSGLLVPPEDPEALAQATIVLLEDRARRLAMGERGRAVALDRFTLDECAAVHVRAYEHALRLHGGAS